jgi:hypothetical protein
MRIAFDLDGVLADLESVLAEAAETMFGRAASPPAPQPTDATVPEAASDAVQDGPPADATPADATPADEPVPALVHQLTTTEQRRLWRRVLDTPNFWESLNETEPGIVGRLAALALERRWEVIFVTQRPSSAGDTCQMQSQRWLARHGFPMPSVFVIRGSRGKVAAALDLDVVVDDRPDNCLDVVVESKARALLVWRGDAAAPASIGARRLNIEVVASVGECLDHLSSEPAEKPAGLIGRLKRLIGS